MRLALSLSGGGFRALVFHLGVLARLAKEDQLENVTLVSTVSGGSLCVGLVYALNEFSWPTSKDYLERVLPKARQFMTTTELQMGLIRRFLRAPWRLFESRANDLSYLLKREWKLDIPLNKVPEEPRWMINSTCFETGKNWRFEPFRMGDYIFGYTNDTEMSLSDAVAASAGYPALIGPLEFDTHPYNWFEYTEPGNDAGEPQAQKQRKTKPKAPAYSKLHLFDGGIYDNNGLEGVVDFIKGWRKNVEFLIVSDASGQAFPEEYPGGWKVYWRLATGILMDQVRSLRSREIIERIINHNDPGAFLQIGNTCQEVLTKSGRTELIDQLVPYCLTSEQVGAVAKIGTNIHRQSNDEFEQLFRHGFEVTDYTLVAYHPSEFKSIRYQNIQ